MVNLCRLRELSLFLIQFNDTDLKRVCVCVCVLGGEQDTLAFPISTTIPTLQLIAGVRAHISVGHAWMRMHTYMHSGMSATHGHVCLTLFVYSSTNEPIASRMGLDFCSEHDERVTMNIIVMDM